MGHIATGSCKKLEIEIIICQRALCDRQFEANDGKILKEELIYNFVNEEYLFRENKLVDIVTPHCLLQEGNFPCVNLVLVEIDSQWVVPG